jgi:hypothetical protein
MYGAMIKIVVVAAINKTHNICEVGSDAAKT